MKIIDRPGLFSGLPFDHFRSALLLKGLSPFFRLLLRGKNPLIFSRCRLHLLGLPDQSFSLTLEIGG